MSRQDEIETIEDKLARSREELRENVSALSEKMTVGQIIDDFFLDGRMDWGSFGLKAADASKIIVPGALLGAGIAMLAHQGVNLLPGRQPHRNDNRSRIGAAGVTPYDPGYDPQQDLEADRIYGELEDVELAYPRRANETELDWHDRVAHRHASVLGHKRNDDEDDNGFGERIQAAVRQAKDAGRSARRRFSKTASGVFHGGVDMAGAAMHAAGDGLNAAKARASSMAHGVSSMSKEQADRAIHLIETNPILGIAVGIGVGALIGTALPVSRQERKAMAAPVNKLMSQAAEAGEQLVGKVERANDRMHDAMASKIEDARRDAEPEIAGAEAARI